MTPKILIVDDEEINCLALEGFLTGDGYDIHLVSRGTEVCGKARELRPDLILLDVMMPDIDGFSVCRLIRADPVIGRIPIILITALDDDASRLEGLRAGADEFITKPCRRAELQARVRTIAQLNRFRAIAEERARFEQLYELAPVAIVLADPAGRVLDANPVAHSLLTPASSTRLTGMQIPDCFDPAGAAAVRGAITTALASKSSEPCELFTVRETSTRHLSMRVTTVPRGANRAMLLIFEDVTPEVQARIALQSLNANLEQLVRARTAQLEEANTLLMSYASFVSHDLRSPLTVVQGYLAMIQEGVIPINAEAAPLVDGALAAAKLMDESVQNILQLAREEHAGHALGAAPPVDPTPILERLVGHLQGMDPNLKTKFVIGPLPAVGASPVVLERVFYNLLTNALKYSAGRSEPRIEIGAREGGNGTILFVRDNGVGFSPPEGAQLFREFSRLTTAAGTDGLGLGLSFVARLVGAHGGRIWAESEAGAGAIFYVEFPHPNAALEGVRATA